MDDEPMTGWWAEPFAPGCAREMASKYATLLAVVRCADLGDRDRDRALRSVARRWPGSLRECQRVRPDRYAERLRSSRLGASEPVVPRVVWRSRGCAAIPLWAELHRLLADQLAWRAKLCGGSRGLRGRDASVGAFVAGLEPGARARWPGADALARMAGDRLGARHAYAWLAQRAGSSVEQLRSVLLDLP